MTANENTTTTSRSSDGVKRAKLQNNSNVLPWVEKYRPSTLEDLVAHEDIISILTRLIDNNDLPHLLL